MSFDVFFQGFDDGEAGSGGGGRMLGVLRPFITQEEPEFTFRRIAHGDAEADVYLSDDGMMANRIFRTDPWDLVVQGARPRAGSSCLWAAPPA